MSTSAQAPDRISGVGAADQAPISKIAVLQKTFIFEIVVLLGNLYAVFTMIGVTYAMATEDGFTGVTLYFGYLVDLSGVAALVAAEVLTLLVAIRTWRMLNAANNGDFAALRKLSSAGWASIAIFSSYIATGVMLLKVNTLVRSIDSEAR